MNVPTKETEELPIVTHDENKESHRKTETSVKKTEEHREEEDLTKDIPSIV